MRTIKPPVPKFPSIRLEKQLSQKFGGVPVAGVDEAGRGPLAGPVVAAAVILPLDGSRPGGLQDSKQLPPDVREKLYKKIVKCAIAYGVGVATAQEIDIHNILGATRIACLRALEKLKPAAEVLITDCLHFPGDPRPCLPVIKGDCVSASVAAASILAKVTRDRMMGAYHEEFPHYGWNTNKGYPTPEHYEALEQHGPTTLHRLTFQGVGFFPSNLRRSSSYAILRERIAECLSAPDPESLDAVERELASREHNLPPPEFEDLRTQLTQGRGTECVFK